jgi:isocitrate lyase
VVAAHSPTARESLFARQAHVSLDPVQITQMAKYLETVYVSGWQCSSTASSSLEPGPDLADYPSNTVPNKVAQLFTAQLFHDRKQRFTRLSALNKGEQLGEAVDYLRPIVADADTGHGGELLQNASDLRLDGSHAPDKDDGGSWCCWNPHRRPSAGH